MTERRPSAPRRKSPSRRGRAPGGPAAEASRAERLQKVLAAAGLGSRRACEELITSGRIEVNGQMVTELGARVDPAKDVVQIDGESLPKPKLVYYAVHKPRGVLSTNRDPGGRARVIDLVPREARVFSVGRLDMESEGLMLLTNDGALAQRLTHPRYEIPKTYIVQVVGQPDPAVLKQLREGVYLAEGFARVEHARIRGRKRQSTLLEVVLREGKNREIRRVFARCGHKVQHLKRIAIGPLRLGELPAGSYRPLDRREIAALKAVAAGEQPQRGAAVRRRKQEAGGAEEPRPPQKAARRPADSRPGRPSKKKTAGGKSQGGTPFPKKRVAKKKVAGKKVAGKKPGRGATGQGKGAKGKASPRGKRKSK